MLGLGLGGAELPPGLGLGEPEPVPELVAPGLVTLGLTVDGLAVDELALGVAEPLAEASLARLCLTTWPDGACEPAI